MDTGNLTTIIKTIVMTMAPVIGLSEADCNAITILLAGVIGFILAMLDAYYPNSFKFLNNHNKTEECKTLEGADEGA